MHPSQAPQPGSPLERAFSGFSKALAFACSFFVLPYIAQHNRYEMYAYLTDVLSPNWAHWGSWGFVIAVTLCCFFGISALLQLLVQLLFRRSKHRGGVL